MNEIERKARDLLKAECPDLRDEAFEYGSMMTVINLHVVMRALRAALTPPEGYVLVPVEKLFSVRQARLAMLQKASQSAAGDESMWGEWAADLGDIIDLHSLAARPEVSP